MIDRVAEGLGAMAAISEAALVLVKAVNECPAKSHQFDNLLPKEWKAFIAAATRYAALADPDAAGRSRDEHGPDIPTKHLDWRDKL